MSLCAADVCKLLNVLEIEAATTLSNAGGAESRTGPVAGAGVEWRSDESDVVLHLVGGEAWRVLGTPESRDAGEDRVGLG